VVLLGTSRLILVRYIQIGHDRLLPNPFLFTIHDRNCHSLLSIILILFAISIRRKGKATYIMKARESNPDVDKLTRFV
jgi:hypothetical protein